MEKNVKEKIASAPERAEEGGDKHERRSKVVPRIYVASLADYTAGRHHGKWIEANQPASAVWEQIQQLLKTSREPFAEEWAIHDFEGFGSINLSEYAPVEDVVRIASLLDEHGEVFAEVLKHAGGPSQIDEAERLMKECYVGAFDRLEDHVAELLEDCYGDCLKGLPELLRDRFDLEGIAADLEMGGDIFTVNSGGKVHVFDAIY